MRKANLLLTVAAVAMLCMCSVPFAKAQTNPGHVYHVATWYMVIGLDSTARAERNAVLKEYLTNVTMKNEYVIHQSSMSHFFTEDSREFVTITEYADLGAIEKAFDRDTELEKLAWPDETKRKAFMKKMESYFTYHKDAIFAGLPSLTK